MNAALNLDRPRIAVGSLTFEGNSFSPLLSGLDQFERCYLLEGEALFGGLAGTRDAMAGAMAALQDADMLPLIAADAGSGGRVTTEAYDALKSRLLNRLSAAQPVDGVYLALHGAMLTEDLDDAEADLLAAVRAVIGPDAVLAVSCDLHANITPAMIGAADILMGFKLYPHDDAYETGERACKILLRAVRKEIKPRSVLRKTAALFPVPAQITAEPFPLSELRTAALVAEQDPRVLALSYFPVHPWLDVPDTGFAAVAVTNDDAVLGGETAEHLCELAWARRHSIATPILKPEAAIEEASGSNGLVLLADVADCVGGGAPGTSAEVIDALLRQAPEAASAAVICAPGAVSAAQSAGVGAVANVALGQEGYGPVVTADAIVERLIDGHFTYAAGPLGGLPAQLGPSAVLRIGGLRVLATTYAAYEYGDEQFAAGGIDVQQCQFAVVKNPVNARLAIPNAAFIVLDTVGPTSPRLTDLQWQRLERPCFPMEDSPEPLWRFGPSNAQY
jgi:microcystin degradation protein MlrC